MLGMAEGYYSFMEISPLDRGELETLAALQQYILLYDLGGFAVNMNESYEWLFTTVFSFESFVIVGPFLWPPLLLFTSDFFPCLTSLRFQRCCRPKSVECH